MLAGPKAVIMEDVLFENNHAGEKEEEEEEEEEKRRGMGWVTGG